VKNGSSQWIGDGFCDDINNNEDCNYDDGDCCGKFVKKHFCMKCECKSKFSTFDLGEGESIMLSDANYTMILYQLSYKIASKISFFRLFIAVNKRKGFI
jgi:hypothetical protein